MADHSRIEWTDATWNPVTGCTKISPGCAHCYAERMAKRLRGRCGYPADDPFRVTLHPDRLKIPDGWKKPRRVFVCSMSDLLHDDIPDWFIVDVWHVMAKHPQHTFQVLTKRPGRLAAIRHRLAWPDHIWVGVSVEDQRYVEPRVGQLLRLPAAVKFVSCEPLLGPVDLQFGEPMGPTGDSDVGYCPCDHGGQRHQHVILELCLRGIDWIIVGGESGPGARPMDPDWVRSLRFQAIDAGVPFFFKQWGGVQKSKTGRVLDGRTWDEMPGGA